MRGLFAPEAMPVISVATAVVVVTSHLLLAGWLCQSRWKTGVWSVGRAALVFTIIAFASIGVSMGLIKIEFMLSDRLWPSADWLLEGLPATLVLFGALPVLVVLSVAFALYLVHLERRRQGVA